MLLHESHLILHLLRHGFLDYTNSHPFQLLAIHESTPLIPFHIVGFLCLHFYNNFQYLLIFYLHLITPHHLTHLLHHAVNHQQFLLKNYLYNIVYSLLLIHKLNCQVILIQNYLTFVFSPFLLFYDSITLRYSMCPSLYTSAVYTKYLR